MTNHTYCFRTHRFRATVLVGMASLGMLLALYGCGESDEPSRSTQFTLSGQVNRSATFTRTELLAFPPTLQSQGPVSGSFTGVSLWTLLSDANGGGDLITNAQVKSATFTPTDLQKFPTVTRNVTFRSGQNTVTGSFTGVSLWTLLTDAKRSTKSFLV